MYTRKQRSKIYLKAAKCEAESYRSYVLAFGDYQLMYRKLQVQGKAVTAWRVEFPEMHLIDYDGRRKPNMTDKEEQEIRIMALLLCYEMTK